MAIFWNFLKKMEKILKIWEKLTKTQKNFLKKKIMRRGDIWLKNEIFVFLTFFWKILKKIGQSYINIYEIKI